MMKWFGMTGNLFRTRAWDGFSGGKVAMRRSGEGSLKGSGLGGLGPVSVVFGFVGFFARAGQ